MAEPPRHLTIGFPPAFFCPFSPAISGCNYKNQILRGPSTLFNSKSSEGDSFEVPKDNTHAKWWLLLSSMLLERRSSEEETGGFELWFPTSKLKTNAFEAALPSFEGEALGGLLMDRTPELSKL